jgi:ribulose-phosphate 3-epimerase
MTYESSVVIAPSLTCCDLCNIERELKTLQQLGIERLHVDLIDGRFSPSMPIGIETVRQAKAVTPLPFDVHLMVTDNEFFVNELADVDIESICFHVESAFHIDRILTLIQRGGAKAGVALMPITPLSILDYCVERIDFILLMLINPGYAARPEEAQVPYAARKVADCRRYLSERGSRIPIHVDGRISFANMPQLVAAGADVLVAGSRSLFHSSAPLADNFELTQKAISAGVLMRAARS